MPSRSSSPAPGPVATTSSVGALVESSSRVVIPLSLAPPLSPAAPAPPSDAPSALLDYVSRLARFEPRMRRYAASKRSETVEPVSAFWGKTGEHESPTPVPWHGRPADADVEATQAGEGAGTNGQQAQVEGEQHTHGWSLLDLERVLLGVAHGKWWKGMATPPPAVGDGLDVDLSQIFRRSPSPANNPALTPEEAALVPKNHGRALFLNYYSSDDLIHLLGSTGVLAALAARGFSQPSLIFDTSDSFQHRLSLVDSSLFDPELHLLSSERFLVDLYMKRRRAWGTDGMVCYQLMKRLVKAGGWEQLRAMTGEVRAYYVGVEGAAEVVEFFEKMVPKYSKSAKKGTGVWDVTEIAWMQMHNPIKKEHKRPLLPGQRFPGLGIGLQVGAVMQQMATNSPVTDALLNFPFHAHNAWAYALHGYRHLDPIVEAYVQWMVAQLRPVVDAHGYCFVAWAVAMGHLRRVTEQMEASGEWKVVSSRLERWSPSEQVYPSGPSLTTFLGSPEYAALFTKYRDIFARDGGAQMTGVAVVPREEGKERRATLVIDLEGSPELWKYSLIWAKRDPETGRFNDDCS